MTLLGERNCYLPRWLNWLPDLGHGESAPIAAEQPQSQSQPQTEADRPIHV
jgi:RND superfamily putative drug exporter